VQQQIQEAIDSPERWLKEGAQTYPHRCESEQGSFKNQLVEVQFKAQQMMASFQ
jgi:hypothetical protein